MLRRSVPTLLAVLALAGAGCSTAPPTGTPPPDATVPPVSSPPAPSETTDPPADPPTEAPPAVDEVAAKRTVPTGLAEATYLGTVGRLVVVGTPNGLAGYRSNGSVAWRFAAPRGDDELETWLLPEDGVAVVTRDKPAQSTPFPGRTRARAVDASTGDLLWSDDDVSFVSAGEGTVLTTGDCTGEQDEFVGDCTISARDPRTGAVRWSAPTYASAMVSGYDDGVVSVDSYATGGGDVRTRIFDVASGAALSPFVAGAPIAVDDGFLDLDSPDRFAGDGCRQVVRMLALDGTVRWSRVLRVGRDRQDGGLQCRGYFADVLPSGDAVAIQAYDGRPWLLDLGDGANLWRGEPGEEPASLDGDVLVTTPSSNGYLEGVDAVDLRTGKTLWSFEVDDDVNEALGLVEVIGRRVVVSPGDCVDPCDTWVLNRRTGKPVATMRGELVARTPDGFVTATTAPVEFLLYPAG